MKSRILYILLIAVVAANMLAWASDTLAIRRNTFDQIGLFMNLRHELVDGYVTEPDQEKMLKRAIVGMIDALNDPYTTYLSPKDMTSFDKQVRGSFSGIGAQIIIDPETKLLKIISPLDQSPAWKAGVMAGDIVLSIDGVSTLGLKIIEAVDQLTGPIGTQVTIKVRHESGEEETFVIIRAKINLDTVKGFQRNTENHWDWMFDQQHKIGYIRLTQFTGHTAKELAKALKSLNKQGAKGLILDLRFNPGGLLDSAVEISDMFLPAKKKIVSIKGRKVPEQAEYATDKGTLFTAPLVVIANEASASAAEIVTGALKDNQRAKFVGTRTFGKGSVQQVRMLHNNQGALKMTTAYYYIPSGIKIHKVAGKSIWGVNPEEGFYVSMTPKQVKKMLEIRRDRDILRHKHKQADLNHISPQWVDQKLKDKQVAGALQALITKIETGKWVHLTENSSQEIRLKSKQQTLLAQRSFIRERLKEINGDLEETNQDLDKISRGEVVMPRKSKADKDAASISTKENEIIKNKQAPPAPPVSTK